MVGMTAPDELFDRLGVPSNDIIDDPRRVRIRQTGRLSDPSDDFRIWHVPILLAKPIKCIILPAIGQIGGIITLATGGQTPAVAIVIPTATQRR